MNLTPYIKSITNKIHKPLVIFDLETTDSQADSAYIVQFYAMRIEPSGKTKELSFLCRPPVKINPEATKVHGISDEQLKSEQPFKYYLEDIINIFKDADIAGYNCGRFDLRILSRQLNECNVQGLFDKTYVFDAYTIFCEDQSRKLGDAVKYYTGLDLENAHEASGDVVGTLAVVAKQLEMRKETFEEIASKSFTPPSKRVGFDKHVIIDDSGELILNFSQKKGKRLREVDEGFLRWMLKQPYISKEVKEHVKQYL